MGLPQVLERIEGACRRAGRDPKGVKLLPVTKGRTPEEIRARVLAYGDYPLGENRVQEALKKMEVLKARWHLVGPLQRNKAKYLHRFEAFHALESLPQALALEEALAKQGKRLQVFIEVNLGREPQKHGVLEEDLPELLARVRELEHLEAVGLMTVPPIGPEEVVRPIFRRLSQLADRFGLPERSMGMSDDLEWAVLEGATWVRVGRAIFEG